MKNHLKAEAAITSVKVVDAYIAATATGYPPPPIHETPAAISLLSPSPPAPSLPAPQLHYPNPHLPQPPPSLRSPGSPLPLPSRSPPAPSRKWIRFPGTLGFVRAGQSDKCPNERKRNIQKLVPHAWILGTLASEKEDDLRARFRACHPFPTIDSVLESS